MRRALKANRDRERIGPAYSDEFNATQLDAEIMQSWVGLPESAHLPATFYVDYVRVWRKAE